MGRAVFGLLMGVLGCVLPFVLIFTLAKDV
jgi:hypothetical protein